MNRPLLLCSAAICALAMTACEPKKPPPTQPSTPESPTQPASPSSKTSLQPAAERRLSLEHCDAFMGYEKNDCLDKARRIFKQMPV